MIFLLPSLDSRNFLVRLRYFRNFFHLRLFVSVHFQYSQRLVTFFFSERSDFSFRYFSFSTFHYEHGTFFNAKFHSYILIVYSYCLYQSPLFFSSFCSLMTSMYMRWLIFFRSSDVFLSYFFFNFNEIDFLLSSLVHFSVNVSLVSSYFGFCIPEIWTSSIRKMLRRLLR